MTATDEVKEEEEQLADFEKNLTGANNELLQSESNKGLTQAEIDDILGLKPIEQESIKSQGIKAMLESALRSYEKLPMLEVVFDRFVRMLSSTMRNFTSDTVEIDIKSISSLRFVNYVDSIPLPTLLSVFRAVEWENFGMIMIDAPLIYSLIDILFGGRRMGKATRFGGRPYTSIEQSIVKQLSELMLADMGVAFETITSTTFNLERIETNPRFATIARPEEAVLVFQLRVEMEERGGMIDIIIPHSTIEPIRELLAQVYVADKFAKDSEWQTYLSHELGKATLELEAVLNSKLISLGELAQLNVGKTIVMDMSPDDDVIINCKGKQMFSGMLGRAGNKMAISINNVLHTKKDNHHVK
jgi:flagellar motor switch protein FliM